MRRRAQGVTKTIARISAQIKLTLEALRELQGISAEAPREEHNAF